MVVNGTRRRGADGGRIVRAIFWGVDGDPASEFLAGLDSVARWMVWHVWRAGIHRSALCQRGELTPGELRSLMMRMGHALRRFQRERGMTLSRPVVADSPLQSYFVDAGFAVVANSQMFDERMGQRLSDGAGRP